MDECYCSNCQTYFSGKQAAAKIQKKNNMEPCKHCKGAGFLKQEKKR
jgi:hypothetical protein